jgi:hypothetical protein
LTHEVTKTPTQATLTNPRAKTEWPYQNIMGRIQTKKSGCPANAVNVK